MMQQHSTEQCSTVDSRRHHSFTKTLFSTSVLNQNDFMFRLDDNTANICVYGTAIAADILPNHQMHSPNIFQS